MMNEIFAICVLIFVLNASALPFWLDKRIVCTACVVHCAVHVIARPFRCRQQSTSSLHAIALCHWAHNIIINIIFENYCLTCAQRNFFRLCNTSFIRFAAHTKHTIHRTYHNTCHRSIRCIQLDGNTQIDNNDSDGCLSVCRGFPFYCISN